MEDVMLKICINQGYVPSTCVLPGVMVLGLTKENGDACKGCNADRFVCYGRNRE